MPIAIAEALNFVLNRGAVARPASFDRTTEQGRSTKAVADDLMGARIGAGDSAGELG